MLLLTSPAHRVDGGPLGVSRYVLLCSYDAKHACRATASGSVQHACVCRTPWSASHQANRLNNKLQICSCETLLVRLHLLQHSLCSKLLSSSSCSSRAAASATPSSAHQQAASPPSTAPTAPSHLRPQPVRRWLPTAAALPPLAVPQQPA